MNLDHLVIRFLGRVREIIGKHLEKVKLEDGE
jgi:hypothetical protein